MLPLQPGSPGQSVGTSKGQGQCDGPMGAEVQWQHHTTLIPSPTTDLRNSQPN